MSEVKELETEKISKLLFKYSLPTIVAMLVNAIYNVVDRIFIGQYVGENALAGLSIVFPIMTILFSFAMLVAIGGSNLISNNLGAGKKDEASKIFCVTICYGVILSITSIVITYIFRFDFLKMVGANDDTIIYAEQYLNIILYGYIFQLMSLILNNSVRAEGMAKLAMKSMITSAITNIFLDYIFIAKLNLGVRGAGLGTIIAQFIGFLILSSFYVRKKSILTVKLEYFKLDLKRISNINRIGFSSFAVNSGSAISTMIMNNSLLYYGGNQAITSMSTAFSIQTLVYMPLFGLRQGMSPIMAYNYGAKNNKRVYDTLFLGMKVACLFSIVCFILIESFPYFFVSFFIKPDSNTMELAVHTLRIFMLMLPIFFINVFGLTLFQTTNRGTLANILTICRQLLIIPFIIFLPKVMGLDGVIFATPISDFIYTSVTFVLILVEYRKDKNW